jgi:hexosaminidase
MFGMALIMATPSFSQAQNVIPRPNVQVNGKGSFTISPNTKFYTNLKGKEKRMMNKYLRTLPLVLRAGRAKDSVNTIRLIVSTKKELKEYEKSRLVINAKGKSKTKEKEVCDPCSQKYRMNVTPRDVTIRASSDKGLFYGVQTLLQLAEMLPDSTYSVPCTEINDFPRFAYRGLMIDVSRHFFPKEFIYKQIDALAYYKIDRLHLHLVDAAGWRIKIKKYPRLTEETAYRPEEDYTKWWINGTRMYCHKDDKGAYGGFYTRRDIKDIVKYATLHHITVIPEIEMPGHSEEVLTAYPELSCSGKPYTNSSYCVGKEITFRFLENVLKEVMKLFPSEYIHIGGDEANKSAWQKCPLCQKRMADEHLKSVDELQGYLITRIERFLNAHGRKLLGWDEILEGKLAPKATVMSWRGIEGGIAAIGLGHHAVMTPGGYCYLDHYQDVPFSQPKAIGGYTPLERTYSYNPVPDSLALMHSSDLIDGVQGNLWTEYVPTTQHAEYMIYPRILALAEVGWTYQKNRSWPDFWQRALHAVDFLKSKGYHPFDLANEVGHRPEALQPISHEALGKKVTYNAPYSTQYAAAGDGALTDGKRGDWSYGDGGWQGFISHDRVDVTIDMEKTTDLHSISAEFMQSCNADVFAPAEIIISVSDDGVNFKQIDKKTFVVDRLPDFFIKNYEWKGTARGRYIRYQAHSDAKFGCWLFTDEIVVNPQ